MNYKISFDKLVIVFITVISVWASSNLNWGKGKPQTIIKADAKAYYVLLPALFIYQDMNLGFFEEYEMGKYYNKNLFYDYPMYYNGRRYTKYYCGTAIAMSPFFCMAHAIAKLTGGPADGYADIYHIFINIAALFYLPIALTYMGKLLDEFGFRSKTKGLTFLAIYFGTNWFYWVNLEPGVSHVYSAAFVPMCIYYYLRFSKTGAIKNLIIFSLLLGLVILIRPFNVVILLAIPIFFTSFESFKSSVYLIFSKWYKPVISFLCIFMVVSIQFILYKVQVGEYVIYGYAEEGFIFSNPQILNFLFSYKKGLFLYTPVLLVTLLGGYYWFKDNRWSLYSAIVFFVVLIYLMSSWHMWWYGGGFGTRVMLEFYCVWSIATAYLIQNSSGFYRKAILTALTVLVIFTQYQTCQYRYSIIHWNGLSQEEYWDVFLKPWF